MSASGSDGSAREANGSESAPAPRRRRIALPLAVVASLLVIGVFIGVTQTAGGRDAALSLLESALARSVNGEVRIGHAISGNLLSDLTVSRFEILDADGELFLALDTVTMEHDPLALLRQQLDVGRLHARGLDLRLRQYPDGRWNYDRIFEPPPPPLPAATPAPSAPPPPNPAAEPGAVTAASLLPAPQAPGAPQAALGILLHDATVASGRIEIRTPWTATMTGAARAEALREARAGESPWALRERPDGEFERVFELTNLSGRFPVARVTDPEAPFMIEVEEAAGTLLAVNQPLDLSNLRMNLTIGDTAHLEIETFETDQSTIRGEGWMASNGVDFEFALEANPLDVRDLRWLPIDLPETGGGPMSIDLSGRGGDAVVDVANGDFRTGQTRMTGGFALALDRRPRFQRIGVTLAPFDLAHLGPLLGQDSVSADGEAAAPGPVAAAAPETPPGTMRGTLRGSGYVDDLMIIADLTLHDPDPDTPPSSLQARGGVGIGEEFLSLRRLGVEVAAFESRWTRLIGMDLGIDGRFEGTLTLDREQDSGVAFDGAVEHRTPAGDRSRFAGSGFLNLARSQVDAAIDANPLALTLLRPWAPGIELAGTVTGPIRARGSLEALALEAELESARGRLTLNGDFDLAAEELRYDTEIEGTDLSLDQWVEGAPASRLAVRGRVQGEGLDPATLEAVFDVEILPSQVDQAEIFDSRVRLRVADGVATIDSAFLASDVGTLSVQGDFGLAEERSGQIAFEAEAPDLSDWDRWVVDEIPGGAAAEAGEALFDTIEELLGRARRDRQPTEGLEGRLVTRGTATGRWGDFTLDADIDASGARFRSYRAGDFSARVELFDPPRLGDLRSRFTATNVELDGRRVDSLSVRLARSGTAEPGADALDAEFYAQRDSSLEVSGRGVVVGGDLWSAGLTDLRLRLGKLESTLQTPARVVYSDSALLVEDLFLNGQLGRLRADGRIPAAGEGSLAVEILGVRVDQFGYLLSEQPILGGTFGGRVTATGTLAEPVVTAEFEVLDPSLQHQGYDALNARVDYADRELAGEVDLVDGGALLGRLGGSVATDLAILPVERRLLDDPFDLDLTGDRLPLALVELVLPTFEAVTGIAESDLSIRGAPGALRYDGALRLVNGRGWVPDLGVWLTDVGARIAFRGSSIALVDSAYVGSDLGGSLRTRGTVDIARITNPVFALDFDADEFHGIVRNDMEFAVSGRARLDSAYARPWVSGDVVLSDGFLEQDEFLRGLEVFNPGDVEVFDFLDASAEGVLAQFRNPFLDNLVLDANVDLGSNLRLQSGRLDAEVVGEGISVYMDRRLDILDISGSAEMPRGTYFFDRVPPYVRPLRITAGSMQFVGDAGFNPIIDITAEYRDRTIDGPVFVEARITGTAIEPEVLLTSNPPMSDTDQYCLLAVGTPCYRSADPQLAQRVGQQLLFGPLSSGLTSALGATGIRYLNLTPIAAGRGAGTVANRSLFERTALEVGWDASNTLFLSYWQPLGGGPPRAALDWAFLPGWSVEAGTASRFDERLFGLSLGTNVANDRTYSLFLFREWEFGEGSGSDGDSGEDPDPGGGPR
ncbi:MAG: translocation/assembly module TamB domain-containing protein [Gemmatimonadota bacterium]|uniref:translocation/assembly module TamB domain-containing protein n=1 Tax=Candidatus Palauibacter scopulicola TaxID=3056741 RepID=UPI00239ED919|nr:translocation/assembly module TamB domain-containing protein [Candidatus Palauibacter scopulicola]MDE2664424.1 translocation/assembly module TamB domain-containing protein [Candidatus Palauibacter scopulicola]